ncbi:MAG: hypothetical protein Q4P20_06190 [Eubacteriales bacterium]|nr:hypothetical protein [Eubacteriales bacterium]
MSKNGDYYKFIDHMFDADLLNTILEMHVDVQHNTGTDLEELEFFDCLEPLYRGLSQPQRENLHRLECLFRKNIRYAMRFSFARGVYSGFDDTPFMRDYDVLVRDQLLTLPNMKKYPEYHHRADTILKICNDMLEQLDGDLREHFVCFECGWENRVQSVAYLSYIFGFLYAQDLRAQISKHVDPELL